MVIANNTTYTKKGNRMFNVFKNTSKLRKGIITNYFDYKAKTDSNNSINISYNVNSIKDLYYHFYDSLNCYMSKSHGYIISKNVLVNPVGELYGRRYYITDRGKSRLQKLRKKYLN